MERLMKTPVKELIARHSGVGEILEQHGIGCVPCAVGTCLLGDIVEIHALSSEEERELLAKLLAVAARGQAVVPPAAGKERPLRRRTISYSPPMRRLVDEHRVIMRFVDLIPAFASRVDLESEEGQRLVADGVDFIRSYADRFHHAKEEEILFARFDGSLDILKAMREDHERGRARVREALEALARRDREGVADSLGAYGEILGDHIRKEDEILYPWMDRTFSTRQVGELFEAFQEVDGRYAEKAFQYERFVADLEETLQVGKEAVK